METSRFAKYRDTQGIGVRVISRKKLLEAVAERVELAGPLDTWYRIAKSAEWRSLVDIRKTFSTADLYEDCTIFNIKGNSYRLNAWVNYRTGKIFIRHALTHAEYDKGGWKNDCKET